MSDKEKKGPSENFAEPRFGEVDPNGEIGAKLKAYFSFVQSEPVPERFLDLLEKLDASERKSTDDISKA